MSQRLTTALIIILLGLAAQDMFFHQDGGGFVEATKPLSSSQNTLAQKSSGPIVTRIIDGDTIVVLVDGVSEKVRLIGVDTPEAVDPRRTVECFGKEASMFTKTLLDGKVVTLEADPSQSDRDHYRRLLRYVFLEDGTLVNEEIIARGYGHEYTYRIPYKYQSQFKNAERLARDSQKGLWAEGVCDDKNT